MNLEECLTLVVSGPASQVVPAQSTDIAWKLKISIMDTSQIIYEKNSLLLIDNLPNLTRGAASLPHSMTIPQIKPKTQILFVQGMHRLLLPTSTPAAVGQGLNSPHGDPSPRLKNQESWWCSIAQIRFDINHRR